MLGSVAGSNTLAGTHPHHQRKEIPAWPNSSFTKNVAVLDREKHSTLRIKPTGDHHFAAKAHAIPLVAAEYVDAGREYPIVFARTTDGKLISFALTGARQDENLYLDANGLWDARYIPAFVRRYPFVFAETGPEQLTVCIDESFPGFNDTEGETLITP